MKKRLALYSLIALVTCALADNQVATLRGATELLDNQVATLRGATELLDNQMATLRGATELLDNAPAPSMAREINNDQRRVRDYPMAAPTVPHKIEGYQIDLAANKCLSCHNRLRVADSQAPMISVTHFMNRDGNFLADVSPNRYFCSQCHASQRSVKLLIENDFVSMDELFTKAGTSH